MSSEASTDPGAGPAGPAEFQAWQLFTLAGLTAATVLVFLEVFVWHADRATAILLSITVIAASFAGYAAYRMCAPLMGAEDMGAPEVLGGRTRAAIDREKTLVLRSIKELEFDYAMKKLSEKDFSEMSARLRARAVGLLRQLDRGSSYRDEIEKELARRIGFSPSAASTVLACAACRTPNDADATFCKRCGSKLGAA